MSAIGRHTQDTKEISMDKEIDTLRYKSNQLDTIAFLQEASDGFGKEHCGLPEGIIIDLFRRLTTLPAQHWHTIPHGALPIPLYSPGECELPLALRYVTVEWNEAFCFRSIPLPIESSESVSEQGEPTLHGITQTSV
jgi:hypothetical protein